MSTLLTRIREFETQEQRFADLLKLTVNELRELREIDSPQGNALYTAWMNFDRGIHPTKAFIAQYTDRVVK
jgi:hypothetical protein